MSNIRKNTVGITRETFSRLNWEYYAKWGVRLCLVGAEGDLLYGSKERCCGCGLDCDESRKHALMECYRWGEATIYDQPDGILMWAVPVMDNSRIIGGIVACTDEEAVFPDEHGGIAKDLPAACRDLREMLERENLTNAALLFLRREEYSREQKRAEAIHDMKLSTGRSIIEIYLKEEIDLVSSIRQGNRAKAVGILNRILVSVYSCDDRNIELVKSFLMELVVTMCRTAVETGAAPEELLGGNYSRIVELGTIDSEEGLSEWVVRMLNRIMDSIAHSENIPPASVVQPGLDFIRENYAKPITRDMAADAARMSPAHFSKMLKEATGHSFTDMLNQVRVSHAAKLLRGGNRGLLQIAFDVGFTDQSYFTKVFRKHMNMTPREYRNLKS